MSFIVAFWILALATTLLNLALIPRLRRDGDDALPSPYLPFVSFIVPARNEAKAIESTVRSLLAQQYPRFEVIVVDDRSTDDTGAILQRLALEDPRLIVITGDEPPSGWLGKTSALHQGSRRATGELLLFVDADIRYAPQALAAAVGELRRSGAAMIALFPNLEMHGFWENVAMPQLPMTGFTFLPAWLGNRTTIEHLAIGGGPGNLIRRDVYDAIGGHETLRAAVIDDIGLARIARAAGHRTLVVRAEELVTLRMYHGAGEIVEGFSKNLFVAFGKSYVVAALAIAIGLYAQIWPYLLGAAGIVAIATGSTMTHGELLALIVVGLITVTRVALFASLRYPLVSAIFGHPLGMLFWIYMFVRSAWRTGVRGEVAWRGRIYDASKH